MNIRTVLSLGAAAVVQKRYFDKVDEQYSLISKKSLISGFMFGLSYFLQFMSVGLLLYLGVIYVSSFSADFEDSLAAIFLLSFAAASAGNCFNYIGDYANARLWAKNLFNILEMKDQHQQWGHGSKLLKNEIKGNIRFENVTFKYENRDENALQNINLDIRQG